MEIVGVIPLLVNTMRMKRQGGGEKRKSYCKLEIDGGAKKNKLENNFLGPNYPPLYSSLKKPPFLAVNMQSHEGLIRRNTSVQVVVMGLAPLYKQLQNQTILKPRGDLHKCN